jgi:replicative DNA helicase
MLQTTILKNLITNEEFTRKVIPFLKKEYFEGVHGIVFSEILKFVGKYNKLPTPIALNIELDQSEIHENKYHDVLNLVKTLTEDDAVDNDWLVDHTEKWCQDRALYLAIMKSISIIDGKDKELGKNALPGILNEALAVGFDDSVGHDYFTDIYERYEFYHKKEEKIPFDLTFFNKICKGGLPAKTLNIILAGTGVGKSLFMCHHAASVISQGKNVLYITLEMAEERIAERIDANLLNVDIASINNISKTAFTTKMNDIARKTHGRLIIKEYPTGAAHAGNFRALIEELKIKKNFKPDMIFIDYLNICSSARIRNMGGSINSYTYIKSIAEEMRGLAVEFNVPLVSATQTTRAGYDSSDVSLTDTSESFGLPATADLMFALISNEELENLNQIMVKQLKNRYNDPSANKRFIIGVDRAKMKLYDVEDSAQKIMDSGQTANVPTQNKLVNTSGFQF